MNVSIRNIAVMAAFSMIGGVAYAGDSCCGSGSYTGGITNIPVVAGQNGCCGAVSSQVVAVPGVYVPGTNVNVGVGGTNIGGTNVYYGGNNVYYGGGSTYYNAGSGGSTTYIGGGGGGTYLAPAPVYNGFIDGLAIGGGQAAAEKIVESKTITEIVPIRAVCIDVKGMPHPASRVDGDEKIAPQFDGEVYRCMAGTALEATIGRMVNGQAVFDGGKAISCTKGQALSYKGGNLTCIAQAPAVNCNERSLLRRFGPGIKYVTLTRTIKVESERKAEQAMTFRSSMFVDGGVGQGVY